MHIYFSGIGGAGIGPLALVAQQAGYEVSGSDKQDSSYIAYLRSQGLADIHIGQSTDEIAAIHQTRPIDWLVYSSALPLEDPNHPELAFCATNNIKATKRDELLTQIISDKNLQLIAVAGTHGKTTTTAMTVWLLKQLNLPIGYILPAKSSFAEMGALEPTAKYFVYECDEFDRNFLAFCPMLSLITGIDWDHPDVYPTRESYNQAFTEFIGQSEQTYIWQADAEAIGQTANDQIHILQPNEVTGISLPGLVNRQNAALVRRAIATVLPDTSQEQISEILSNFPGVSRRFEQIIPGLFSDYAHTPPKIRGALQLGHETADDKLVVIYEGLHNTRQHFIKEELSSLFESVKHLYLVPSYLAREDESLELLTPSALKNLLSEQTQTKTTTVSLDENLKAIIQHHLEEGDTVLCLSAGGGKSLDEWLRAQFQ